MISTNGEYFYPNSFVIAFFIVKILTNFVEKLSGVPGEIGRPGLSARFSGIPETTVSGVCL